jgi:hypothetical protein
MLSMTACSSPAIGGFSLTAAPTTVTITQGSTSYLTIASTGTGTQPVTSAVVLYNLPVGVTASPNAPTVTTGSQTVIALTADAASPVVNNQVQITGYAGLAANSVMVNIGVVAAP